MQVRILDPETGIEAPDRRPRRDRRARAGACSRATSPAPGRRRRPSTRSGWFHTGDWGSLDELGRISYHGRLKDMLKIGGENVAAVELESFLASHPAVAIVQVVGVPDDHLVEVAAAFVELSPGAELSEDELVAFCRGAIASYKIPRYVRFVDEWPMSATKIQKAKLREQLLAELESG